jgi:serine/threonine protein phosphatase PrpC
MAILDDERGLYILADGVGHGEHFAILLPEIKRFVEGVYESLKHGYEALRRQPKTELQQLFDGLNMELYALREPALCQLDVAYVPQDGGNFWLFHAGDSAAIQLKSGCKTARLLAEEDTGMLGNRQKCPEVCEFPIERGDIVMMFTDGTFPYKKHFPEILGRDTSVDAKAKEFSGLFRKEKPTDDHTIILYQH